jgi:hypothetical protein
MVRTGAHAYLKYGFETAFATISNANLINKKFGLQDKLSSFSLTNNKVDLNKLNQNTVDKYAYGQESGTMSVGFTLSNPWIFGTVLGAPTKTGSGSPYTYTYPQTGGLPKTPRTIQVEVGFDGASADIVRTAKGCLVNSLSINAAVGGLAECTTDITYGKESAPSTSLNAVPTLPSVEFPYTFAHAELYFAGQLVAQCQDASMNISQNTELLYGLNSHQAVDSFRRVLSMTGSFRASLIDKDLLEKLLAQIKQDTSAAYQETVGGGATEFKFTFIKDNTNEKIEISMSGLGINDLSVSGIEPVEPIFEEITWTAKTISVVAKSTIAAEE